MNEACILSIDTSQTHACTVELRSASIHAQKHASSAQFKSQMVLPLIEEILTNTNKNLKDLTAIEVNIGPGSFTGVRVGVSVANMLGYILHIPVNGSFDPILPQYAASPFDVPSS